MRKIIALILVFSFLFGVFPIKYIQLPVAEAEVFSGEVEGWTYFFDDETGTLVIIGKGPMPSFKDTPAPWSVYADKVTKVVCDDGITSISENAFAYFPKLDSISLPATIETIDANAFTGSNEIKSVEFSGDPEKLMEIIEKNEIVVLADLTVSAVSTTNIEKLINSVVEKTTPEAPSAYNSYLNDAGRVAHQTTIDDSDKKTPETTEMPTTPSSETNDALEDANTDGQSDEDEVRYMYYAFEDGSISVEKYVAGKLVYSEEIYESGSPSITYYEYNGDDVIREKRITGTKESSVNYIYENGKVVKILESNNSNWKAETTISYDGNKRIEIQTESDGSKTIAQYEDDQQVLVEGYNSSGQLRYKDETINDGQTSTSVYTRYNSGGNVTSKETRILYYDNNRNIVTEKYIEGVNHRYEDETHYSYNNEGVLTEESTYKVESGQLVLTDQRKYGYDANGNNTEVSNYSVNSETGELTLYGKNIYVYDGDLLKSYEYHDYYGETYSEKIEYTYDGEKAISLSKTVDIDTSDASKKVTNITYEDGLISRINSQGTDTSETTEMSRTDGVLDSYKYLAVKNGITTTEREIEYVDTHVLSETTTRYKEGKVTSQNKTSLTYNTDGTIATRKKENRYGTTLDVTETAYNDDKTITYNKREFEGKLNSESTSVSVAGRQQSSMNVNYQTDGSRNIYSDEYDSEGRCISSTSEYYDKYNLKKSMEIATSVYDDNGKQIERKQTNYDGSNNIVSSNKSEYTYDDNGYQTATRTTYYDKAGIVSNIQLNEYIYDDAGRQTFSKNTSYNAKGEETDVSEHETYFDENGIRTGSRDYTVSYYDESNYHNKGEHERVYDANYKEISGRDVYYRNNAVDYSSEYKYVYDENGNRSETIQTGYDSEGKVTSSTSIKYEGLSTIYTYYDENGLVTSSSSEERIVNEQGTQTGNKWTYYDAEGNLERSEVSEYLFDSYGHQIGRKSTEYDKSGTVTGTTLDEFIFDSMGNIVDSKITRYYADGKISSVSDKKYDNDGNRIGTVSTNYDENGNIKYYSTYTYDAEGRQISSVSEYYNADGSLSGKNVTASTYEGEIRKEITEDYDANGTLIGKYETKWDNGNWKYNNQLYSYWKSEDGFYHVANYQYDEEGHQISNTIEYYDADGKLTSTSEYTNEYNTDGNQIKCVSKSTTAAGTVTEYNVSERIGDGFVTTHDEIVRSWDNNSRQVSDYTYDDNGNRIGSNTEIYNADGTISKKSISQTTYEGEIRKEITEDYDANGTLIGKYETKWDNDNWKYNHQLYSYWKSEDGSYQVTNYQYDEEGRQISNATNYYDADGNKTSSQTTENLNNESGIIIGYRYMRRDAEDKVTEWYESENINDEAGTQIGSRTTYFDSEGNKTSSNTSVNIYDDQNNIIGYTYTSFDENDEVLNSHDYYYEQQPVLFSKAEPNSIKSLVISEDEMARLKGNSLDDEQDEVKDPLFIEGNLTVPPVSTGDVSQVMSYPLMNQQPVSVFPATQVQNYTTTPFKDTLTMRVTNNQVAVRKAPDMSADTISRVDEGDSLSVIGVTEDGWYVLENGSYVRSEYLTEYTTTSYEVPVTKYISANQVAIRKAPGLSSEVVNRLDVDDTVKVISVSSDGWYKLDNGYYVSAEFINDQPKPKPVGGTAAYSGTKTTTGTSLLENDFTMFDIPVQLKVSVEQTDLREGAGYSFASRALVTKDTELVAIGKKGSAENEWYLLDNWLYIDASEVVTRTNTNLIEERHDEELENIEEPEIIDEQESKQQTVIEATPGEALAA